MEEAVFELVLYDEEKCPPPHPTPREGKQRCRVRANAERLLDSWVTGREWNPLLGFDSALPAMGTPQQCLARGVLVAH